MGDLSSGKKERFQLLLQQLQLTEDVIVTHFQNAEIDRVVIEKQARKWHFFFQFERIVPCQLYNTFRGKLEQTFSHIAKISYSARVLEQAISDQEILDYWKSCIKEIDGIAPPLLKLLNEQVPQIQGTKIILTARNEAEGLALKRKYGGVIAEIYQSFGFPLLTIDTVVSEESSSDEYEKFMKAKEKEDQERGLMAMIEMQKKEAEQAREMDLRRMALLILGLRLRTMLTSANLKTSLMKNAA
ncbi:DNA polymerase III alpha subunit [Mesobacillus boroniphilus JCM 21738]|uniref:DNA polymerase III alpha subunit n=1 Tax=Mesobacillus boroniphilus JCM 21738 TaxID=1294265 RepID=W4RHC0_9BACI|nr:DNA polymerase III alpha subunit [Mesobacillus boroniphilus JCM 21738]